MNIIGGPYLQNVSKTSITVMWHTDEPGTSVTEYSPCERLGWSAYDGRPTPVYRCKDASAMPVTLHAVRLDGLEQEQTYFYRVSSVGEDGETALGPEAVFRTGARHDSPFTFATYGDAIGPEDAHRRNAELIRAYRADLCVGTGDVALDTIDRFKPQFLDCTRDLLRYTPWFATMGNHDSPNEAYYQYFSYPEPRYWYSFNYGCAHFVVLNSNMDYRPGSEQWLWLKDDLTEYRDAIWRFVFFHHPPYCSNNCEIADTRVLCPLFEEHGVDIVYNAHATLYERFHPLRGGRYDSRNGVVYLVSGGGGYDMTQSTAEFWAHRHSFSALAKPVNHFLLTAVSPDECHVKAIDNEDRVFDALTLRKEPEELPFLPDSAWRAAGPDNPDDGTPVAGLEEGPVRWVLPPQHEVDRRDSHSGGNSIQWHGEDYLPVLPAARRVLKDDGKVLGEAAGKPYTVSAWVKTKDVDGGVFVSLEWNGDMGFIGRADSEPVAGTHDWTRLQFETPVLPGHIYACRLLLSAKRGSAGTAWFDDIQITPSGGDGDGDR